MNIVLLAIFQIYMGNGYLKNPPENAEVKNAGVVFSGWIPVS